MMMAMAQAAHPKTLARNVSPATVQRGIRQLAMVYRWPNSRTGGALRRHRTRQVRQISVACEKTSLKTVEKVQEKTTLVPASSLDEVERIAESGIYTDTATTAVSLENESKKAQKDFLKALGTGSLMSVSFAILNHTWFTDHQSLSMIGVFALGYLAIIFEEKVALNKSGVALLMAVALWTIRATSVSHDLADHELESKVAEVSSIVFFLIGAMTIVETIDAHKGFNVVSDIVKTKSKKSLLWIVGATTFVMSAVLDNLTSTIVMVSLLGKLVKDPELRGSLGAIVVIAANAGGAWTPIGDVTTTMLWVDGELSTGATMRDLIVPSLTCTIVPLAYLSLFDKAWEGDMDVTTDGEEKQEETPNSSLVFAVGLGSLLFVPAFKTITGLPPYLGMLMGLGSLWLLTDAIHFGKSNRSDLLVPRALTKIDIQGVLFFLGVLLSVSSLDAAGILKDFATWLQDNVPDQDLIATLIGLASAVVDNVPLVAATMGMYDLNQFPQDDQFWQLIAFCAGTGGSILIIGSAAGVAFMGMEEIGFVWYLRKISGLAFAGYLGGIGAYIAMHGMSTH